MHGEACGVLQPSSRCPPPGTTARWLEDLGRDGAGQGQGLFRCLTIIKEQKGKEQGACCWGTTPVPADAWRR